MSTEATIVGEPRFGLSRVHDRVTVEREYVTHDGVEHNEKETYFFVWLRSKTLCKQKHSHVLLGAPTVKWDDLTSDATATITVERWALLIEWFKMFGLSLVGLIMLSAIALGLDAGGWVATATIFSGAVGISGAFLVACYVLFVSGDPRT